MYPWNFGTIFFVKYHTLTDTCIGENPNSNRSVSPHHEYMYHDPNSILIRAIVVYPQN